MLSLYTPMKANIHPAYQNDVKVTCACGNSFVTGSIKSNISVEVCFKCHPFYTGEHRFLDTQGRVENFQKKQQAAQVLQAQVKAKKAKKQGKSEQDSKSLRELLGGL